MSLRVPLVVRISGSRRDIDITDQLYDLTFRSSVPGGYATATFSMNRPLDILPGEIEYYAKVFIYDGRHGGTIWEGRLEDPGRSAGDQGEIIEINAIGPRAHALDRWFPIVYVDTNLERWQRSRYSSKKAATESSEIDEDTPALQVRSEEGTAIAIGWTGDWIYRTLWYCGQRLARIRADTVAGGSSSSYRFAIVTRLNAGSALFSLAQSFSTTPTFIAANTGTASFDLTANVASLRVDRQTTATTATEDVWGQFYNVSIQAQRKDASGVDITASSAYATNDVDPVDVVADLLGRILTKFYGPGALLVGSGVDITQLAYPDGTTADAILTDLMTFDPGFYWAAWESVEKTGRNRFEYVPWPSSVRYEANIDDGFDSPSSAGELYNAVLVRWRDPNGVIRNTRRTQTVKELSDAGLTREAYIDISDDMGSATNAQYVGDNFLSEHKYPPNSGTLTVARPILDKKTGRMVMPWEILPGNLIRVRGVQPRVDALNPSGRDGVTVFRLISAEFNQASASATLELDSYARTVQRALSRTKSVLDRTKNSTLRRR